MTIDFDTETVRTFDRLEALSNRTVGVAKLCRHGLTGKEWSRDPVPTGCFDHGVSMILTTRRVSSGDVMAVRRLHQGQDAGGDGVDSRRVVGACRDRKSLILLRRFYTRSAAAGSKDRLVKVSPASIRGMSIGDDPTARR
jgi:hypothetical protein